MPSAFSLHLHLLWLYPCIETFLPFQKVPPTKHPLPLYPKVKPFEQKKKHKKEYTLGESPLPCEKKIA